MINYILGGLIIGFTIYTIVKYVKNMKKSGCSCGQECTGCDHHSQPEKCR